MFLMKRASVRREMRAVYTADFRENIKHYLCLFVAFFRKQKSLF